MRPQVVTLDANGNSTPLIVDSQQQDFKVSLQVTKPAGSNISATVQSTSDDPTSFTDAGDMNTNANWFDVTGLAPLTGATEGQGNLFFPVRAVRLVAASTVAGSATLTVLQANAPG